MPTRSTSRSPVSLRTPCGTPAGAHTAWPSAGRPRLASDNEPALALDHEIELVLPRVLVQMLLLARRQTVETEHELCAAEQGGLELLVGQGAHMITVVGERLHG